ncbi:Ig-like domain-containing protein [Stenotrophomonas sp. Iso1]|uniref:Ig-like domain-containing protein n=1 Tax=Stenotrophomonas sp. Iso1 TaxID=2977283 RepID=UPI0022B78B72|nr:Ig-like domain-containing protein [Stenotrophomonas sp. Iso1]
MTATVRVGADNSITTNGELIVGAAGIAASVRSSTPAVGAVLDDKGAKLGLVADGGYTDDSRPEITGKAAAGTMVHLYNDSELIGRITVGASGEWSFIPRAPLVDGRHEISVVYEYTDGDISDLSEPYVIFVDKIAPDTPIIQDMVDDEGRITGNLGSEDITDDSRPTVAGTTEANATVIVYDKGKEIGRVQADDNGAWRFTPEPPLADGTHILEYMAMDPAGNQSEKSEAFEFVVDTRPELVNIFMADDDAGSITGLLLSGSATDDTTPTLIGSATAGGIVKFYEGDVYLGQVTAGIDGRWTFTPIIPLSEGPHTLQATVTLPAKGESDRSKPFLLTVDVTVPDRPSIDAVIDDMGAVTGNLAQGQKTDDITPTLSGKAEAGSTVHIYDQSGRLGSTQADVHGNWSFTPMPLAEGEHRFTVTSEDKAGNLSEPSDLFAIDIDLMPPATPSIEAAYDDHGIVTGSIISGGFTDDTTPTLSGKAEAGSTVHVFDQNGRLGSVQSDENGKWSFTPNAVLNDGAYRFTVTSEDKAGNVSAPSNSFVVNVDTVAPSKPTIETVYDDQGAVTGNLVTGAITDDVQPAISGKAVANSTVIIYDKDVEIGRVPADASGNWTFTPATALSEGAHGLTVKAQTEVNISEASDLFEFTVSLVPTQTVTITSLGKDSGFSNTDGLTNDGSAGRLMQGQLSAALRAGETLQVSSDGGKTWKAAIVNDVTWVAQDDMSHAGSWTVQARVMNEAGSTGPMQSQAVVLDSAPLGVPNSYSTNGSNPSLISINISGCGAEEGDKVHVIYGGISAEHVLTKTDLLNPKEISIKVEGVSAGSTGLMVGLIDKAGNVSDYRVNYEKNLSEDFSSAPLGDIGHGDSIDIGSMTIKNINGLFSVDGDEGGVSSGITSTGNAALNSASLVVYEGYLSIDLKGGKGTSLSGILFDVQTGFFDQAIRFYDEDNNLVHVEDLHKYANSVYSGYVSGLVTINVPEGKTFSRFEFDAGNDYIGLDDISIVMIGDSIVSANGIQTITADTTSLYGGALDNVFDLNNVSHFDNTKVEVHGGSGSDTLKLTGTNQTLNLTTLAGKLSSVEVIDITGTGNNTLELSLADVMNNGGMNQYVTDGRVQMMVKGNAGDKVTLTDLLPNGVDAGDWAQKANVTVSSVVYEVYQHSGLGAELLVQQGVTVTLQNEVDTFSAVLEGDVAAGGDSLANVDDAGDRIGHAHTKLVMQDGGYKLNLSLSDVMDNGARNFFEGSDNVQMMIKGGAGDRVELDDLLADGMTDLGDWAASGSQTVDDVIYNVYQHSGMVAELLVQDAVTVNLV